MLDLELKNLCLIFLFIGREEGVVNIVEKYEGLQANMIYVYFNVH
jgi:hypothetical protein